MKYNADTVRQERKSSGYLQLCVKCSKTNEDLFVVIITKTMLW